MSWLSRFALLASLTAGIGGVPSMAQAAPASAAPMLGAAAIAPDTDLLQDVRWVNRCRMVTERRRDRYGRPVRVERERCRRVWVGPPRHRRY
ncbi:hypothetical protein [Roseomonas xinghualingensis]|uniref:hypothetical protein n=1 Tax=Roseomonas xinghualingensis TaxID=2986475 RepID=UPI0021F0EDF3|nr:hypothetical protein [Roseomonas sp. SXEYE001]MCV4206567.1 hypothetical protein [Roseomonas sp. SXEYE001]